MLYETASQALEVPFMMLAGMAMAGVSLLFHMIRHVICAGKWLSLVCDLVMGLIWSVIFCAAITIANRGALRMYHIFCTAAGAALFHSALGIPLRRICRAICCGAGRMKRGFCQNRLVQALLR